MTTPTEDAKKVQGISQEMRLLVLASQQALSQDVNLCRDLLADLFNKVQLSVTLSDKLATRVRNLETDNGRQKKLVQAKMQTITCLRNQLSASTPGPSQSAKSPSSSTPLSCYGKGSTSMARSDSAVARSNCSGVIKVPAGTPFNVSNLTKRKLDFANGDSGKQAGTWCS